MAEDKEKKPKGSYPPKLNLAEAGDVITQLYERTGSEASFDELSEIFGNTTKSSTRTHPRQFRLGGRCSHPCSLRRIIVSIPPHLWRLDFPAHKYASLQIRLLVLCHYPFRPSVYLCLDSIVSAFHFVFDAVESGIYRLAKFKSRVHRCV